MRVAHVLRKYNPSEWGGTETAVRHLLDGLRAAGVESVLHCPSHAGEVEDDPLAAAGYRMRRFKAIVPAWGLTREAHRQLMAVGGNIISWDMAAHLGREQHISVIHAHAGMRLGGIARQIARWRGLPFVLTLHGSPANLPVAVHRSLVAPLSGSIEWGKVVGWMVGSHKLLALADALITPNASEARLLCEAYPGQRVAHIPHGIPMRDFQEDFRAIARSAFPALDGCHYLVAVGRVEPAKNQLWLIEQMPEILRAFPEFKLVLVGAVTHDGYAAEVDNAIRRLGLEKAVVRCGGLPPRDPRLIGLIQGAAALVLPSASESFGLVLLEAWACATPVISSDTPGGADLVKPGENGWLFDLGNPASFYRAVARTLSDREEARRMSLAGRESVARDYDVSTVAMRTRELYESLVEARESLSRGVRGALKRLRRGRLSLGSAFHREDAALMSRPYCPRRK